MTGRRPAATFLAVLACLSAAAADPQGLYGTWERAGSAMELRRDGTLVLGGLASTFKVVGNTLETTIAGVKKTYTFRLAGDTLTLSGGGLPQPITFTRDLRGATPETPRPLSPAPAHVGDWTLKTPQGTVEMSLKPDGTLVFMGKVGKYRVSGAKLATSIGGGTYVYDLELADDTLSLTGADLGTRVLTFQRKRVATTKTPSTLTTADITDKWFLPPGKTLRGFYGGAIYRKTLKTHMTTAAVPVETVPHSRVDTAMTGGDFRVAFYGDGTMRAKLMLLNYGPMVSYNVPFRYAGTYKLAADGKLTTSDMALTGEPRTYLKFEQKMAKMRLSGQYDKAADRFNVHVETYNPQQARWYSKGRKILSRATKRRSCMFGTATTPDTRIDTSVGP